MGKWITGIYKSELHFNNVYVEEGQDELDALFPEGWDGEMWNSNLTITLEKTDEEEDD